MTLWFGKSQTYNLELFNCKKNPTKTQRSEEEKKVIILVLIILVRNDGLGNGLPTESPNVQA